MRIQQGLEAALNNVATEGDSWVAGWDEFFVQIASHNATINEALEKALIVANDGRPLPTRWMAASIGQFWRAAKQPAQPQEEAPEEEAPNEEAPEEPREEEAPNEEEAPEKEAREE